MKAKAVHFTVLFIASIFTVSCSTFRSAASAREPNAQPNGLIIAKPTPKPVEPAADPDGWIGKYEHEDDGANATGTRSYVEVQDLEIRRDPESADYKLIAILIHYDNSDIGSKSELEVKLAGDTATFYFLHCLSIENNDPCVNYLDKKGDLMFRMSSTAGKNNSRVLLTYSGKKGDEYPNGKVYFKKVKKFMQD